MGHAAPKQKNADVTVSSQYRAERLRLPFVQAEPLQLLARAAAAVIDEDRRKRSTANGPATCAWSVASPLSTVTSSRRRSSPQVRTEANICETRNTIKMGRNRFPALNAVDCCRVIRSPKSGARGCGSGVVPYWLHVPFGCQSEGVTLGFMES